MANWSTDTKIEEKFVNFHCDVINSIYQEKYTMVEWSPKCQEALPIIGQMWSDMNEEEQKSYYNNVNFRESPIRFAYVFAFSIIHTCTVYQHFLHLFNKNEHLKSIIKAKRNIRICCLGGGPGVEIIAVCKLLNDFFKETICTSSFPNTASGNSTSQVYVQVTIVDICINWQSEAFNIIYATQRLGITDSKYVSVQPHYIQTDLTKQLEKDLEDEMKEADIVTMVRLGNEIIGRNSEKLSALCQNLSRIVQLLKVGSCLFIQESGGGSAFGHLKATVDNTARTDVESYEDADYVLQQTSVQKFQSCFTIGMARRKFSPINRLRSSSCIWVKTRTLQKEEMPTKRKKM